MPLNCTPKNGYSDKFLMYILLQLKKKRQIHKGRKGEKATATKFWKLAIISWQDIKARSEKAENHLDLYHIILQRLSQCCLSGKGDGIHCRMKSVRSGTGSPSLSCCLRKSLHLQTSGDFLKNLSQKAEWSLDNPSRQEERYQGCKTNNPEACGQFSTNKPHPLAQSS